MDTAQHKTARVRRLTVRSTNSHPTGQVLPYSSRRIRTPSLNTESRQNDARRSFPIRITRYRPSPIMHPGIEVPVYMQILV